MRLRTLSFGGGGHVVGVGFLLPSWRFRWMMRCVGRIYVFQSGLFEADGLEHLLLLVPGSRPLAKCVFPSADQKVSTSV